MHLNYSHSLPPQKNWESYHINKLRALPKEGLIDIKLLIKHKDNDKIFYTLLKPAFLAALRSSPNLRSKLNKLDAAILERFGWNAVLQALGNQAFLKTVDYLILMDFTEKLKNLTYRDVIKGIESGVIDLKCFVEFDEKTLSSYLSACLQKKDCKQSPLSKEHKSPYPRSIPMTINNSPSQRVIQPPVICARRPPIQSIPPNSVQRLFFWGRQNDPRPNNASIPHAYQQRISIRGPAVETQIPSSIQNQRFPSPAYHQPQTIHPNLCINYPQHPNSDSNPRPRQGRFFRRTSAPFQCSNPPPLNPSNLFYGQQPMQRPQPYFSPYPSFGDAPKDSAPNNGNPIPHFPQPPSRHTGSAVLNQNLPTRSRYPFFLSHSQQALKPELNDSGNTQTVTNVNTENNSPQKEPKQDSNRSNSMN